MKTGLTPARTPRLRTFTELRPTDPLVRELASDSPAPATAFEAVAKCRVAADIVEFFDSGLIQAIGDDRKISRLIASIESKNQPETIGERELLLKRFAVMKLVIRVHVGAAILFHGFGKEMFSITCRNDADPARPCLYAALKRRLQLAEANFT